MGKKKINPHDGEPSKRSRSSRSIPSGPGGSSNQQQHPYIQAYIAKFGASRGCPWSDSFFRERNRDRYDELKSLKFMPEKGFADGLSDVPDIFLPLRDRRWLKFNELLEKSKMTGNDRLVREFYANAWQPPIEVNTHQVYVRGVIVDYSPEALNRFLGARIPRDGCALMAARPIDGLTLEERIVIRDYVGRPGIEWLKYRGGPAPKKIKLVDFKPSARAWGEWVLRNIAPVSNLSEYQLDNALTVKLILEGAEIDLGYWLSESISRIARHSGTFSLGHCNLITALCRHLKVPETFEDPPFYPIKAMTFAYYNDFEEDPIGGAGVENEEDEELHEIDMYEAGAHPDQQQPEIPAHTHSEDDIAALMTQLAIAEACHVPHTYYSSGLTLYQAAMARRASFQAAPMYLTYPTLEKLRAQHDIENAQVAARHVSEEQRWGDEYAAYQRTHFYEADLGLDRRQDGSGPSHQL
jgi:hypothetical protein